MENSISFDDVLLVPQYSDIDSRSSIILDSFVTKEIKLKTPIIAANMQSVTSPKIAVLLWNMGAFAILPRFNTIYEAVKDFNMVQSYGAHCGVSLGVGDDRFDRLYALYNAGARIFCVDVAHGHHRRVGDFVTHMRVEYGNDIEIIAGNVATYSGCMYLAEAGADAIKVGIGPGAACSTREVTGFGVPQLSALEECAPVKQYFPDLKIISDGGIKNSGDIVKALAFRADTVMLGRMLAGAQESPYPGLYFGNASARVRDYRSPEGVEGQVPIEGKLEDIVKKINWGIKSGLSYAGLGSIEQLHLTPTEFVFVSPQTMTETRTRI